MKLFLKSMLVITLAFQFGCSAGSKKKDDLPEATYEDEELVGEQMVDDEDFEFSDLEGELATEGEATKIEDVKSEVSLDEGSEDHYEVKKHETLMLIAFKIYGDYRMWKDIAVKNQGKFGADYKLYPGMKLKYTPPKKEFVWNPEGNPYLIKRGDTLGLISKDVYGTHAKWKKVWHNNRPLIRHPNIIFAGFTLYWLPDKTVANL